MNRIATSDPALPWAGNGLDRGVPLIAVAMRIGTPLWIPRTGDRQDSPIREWLVAFGGSILVVSESGSSSSGGRDEQRRARTILAACVGSRH